jgi:hypothetical protein
MGWRALIILIIIALVAFGAYFYISRVQMTGTSSEFPQLEVAVSTEYTDQIQRELVDFQKIRTISLDSLNSTVFRDNLFQALHAEGTSVSTSSIQTGRSNPFAPF